MKYRSLLLALLVTSIVYFLIDNGADHQENIPRETTERVNIKNKTLMYISELASHARNDDLDSYVGTLKEISFYLNGLSDYGQFYFRDVLVEVPDDEYEVIVDYDFKKHEKMYELIGDVYYISDIIILAMQNPNNYPHN